MHVTLLPTPFLTGERTFTIMALPRGKRMFTILKEAIDMEYPHAERYPVELVRSKIMGPNPLKLAEEVLERHPVLRGSRVLDLGSGMALTSAFLYQQYGFTVTAGDLWSDPNENQAFLSSLGITSDQVHAVHADATDLPFGSEEFDAITCIDAYNFFGREGGFLDTKLLPFLKPHGRILLAISGLTHDCHNDIPPELLVSWTPEQLDYMHDITWWRGIFEQSTGARIVDMWEMQTNDKAWADWLACDNPYAVGDRASMEAGSGKYLNFIGVVLEKLSTKVGM